LEATANNKAPANHAPKANTVKTFGIVASSLALVISPMHSASVKFAQSGIFNHRTPNALHNARQPHLAILFLVKAKALKHAALKAKLHRILARQAARHVLQANTKLTAFHAKLARLAQHATQQFQTLTALVHALPVSQATLATKLVW
jgi:hypothetical protein